ncbi:MAG: hypothetical protein ACJA1H_002347, partial [Glaciecola sp.]
MQNTKKSDVNSSNYDAVEAKSCWEIIVVTLSKSL